uniref:Uncharacterized protein n=1 Tax=Arundo donax TaxID=35708 RepID=A0A0A9EX59_ARUDO
MSKPISLQTICYYLFSKISCPQYRSTRFMVMIFCLLVLIDHRDT